MKKIALAFVALIIIFVIYYITIGSKQLTVEIKKEVNRELVQLKGSGIGINEQNLSTEKQKILLTFQDTDKITTYLNKQGLQLKRNDIEILKGMQIGIDIEYNPNTSDAVAMDIYPIKLPISFYQNIDKNDNSIVELEKMIKDKLLVIHVNINKLLSSFDGYVKDIDREFKDNGTTAHLVTKGFNFDGTINDKKIEDIKETIETISYQVDNQLNININGLTANVQNSDKSLYNNIEYSIKSLDIMNKIKKPFSIKINDISGISQDKLKANLLDSESKVKISSIDFTQNGKKTILSSIIMDTLVKNINKKALDKLQKLSSKDIDNNEIMPILKEILKDDISIDIPNISIAKITSDGKSFDGFKIKALIKTDKNFDWKSLDNNPLAVSNLFDAKVNIEASNEFINLISSANPQVMVIMMVLQPVEKNGKKYYDIEFSKGELKINGKPFM